MRSHKISLIIGVVAVVIGILLITGKTQALSMEYSASPTPSSHDAITHFLNVRDIVPPALTVPAVVELPLSSIEGAYEQYMMVYEVETQKPVYSAVKTTRGRAPITITSTLLQMDEAMDVVQLHDRDASTDIEALTDGSETTTTFTYSSEQTITASSLKITLAQNAFRPLSLSIYAANPPSKVSRLVASDIPFGSGLIAFPRTIASEWQIRFVHNQPLRIAELEVIPENSITSEYRSVRFLARPNMTYKLYWQTDGQTSVPFREYVNLDNDAGVLPITASGSYPNPQYQKPDSDADGILDANDNCPRLANPDQTDVNMNGMGDACEDFDRDGYINSRDNCPHDPNGRQTDTDGDGFGDICDPEESRLTERMWWLPWMGIVVGFGVVFFIFASTVHTRPRTPIKVD